MAGMELTTDPDGAYMIWLPVGRLEEPAVGGDGRTRRALRAHGGPRDVPVRDQDARFVGVDGHRAAPAGSPRRSICSSRTRPTSGSSNRSPRASGCPMEKMFVNVDRYGNTSAASVPIALAEAVDSGRVKIGDKVVFVAFGAGFTSGAVAVEWTADPAQRQASRVRRAGRLGARTGGLGLGRSDAPALAAVLADSERDRRCPSMTSFRASPSRPTTRCRHEHAIIHAPATGGRPMIDLSGKSAVVTGASRGIGRAIALRLAEQGANVAFSYKGNAAAAEETAAAIKALGPRGAGRAGGREPAGSRRKRSIKAALERVRPDRHPGQQRRHHAGRPDHAHEHRRLAGGPRNQPLRRVLHDQGRHPADAQGARRTDHQHHQRFGTGRPDGPGELLVREGGVDRTDQGDRARARQPQHHLQRRRAGLRADGADPGPARCPEGGASRTGHRWDASGRQRKSPRRSLSSLPTRQPSSRGRCSRWTAAS